MPRIIVLFLTLFFLAEHAVAQEEGLPKEAYLEQPLQRTNFDRDQWAALKSGIDYSRDPARKRSTSAKKGGRASGSKEGHKSKNTTGNGNGTSGQNGGNGPGELSDNEREEEEDEPYEIEIPSVGFGMGPLFKWLFIAIAVAALIFLIVKFLGGASLGSRNNKLKHDLSNIDLEKIEENLQEAELDDPIRQAVAAGNFPLAVRLYYLAVLKEFALKKHIRWKREKTNGTYLRELAGSSLAPIFREATLVFERVWYGKVELTREDFLAIEAKFKNAVAAAGTGVGKF